MALEAELALTQRVLGAVANSTLGDVLDQPLLTLRHIHSKLQACVRALGSRAMSVGSDHPCVSLCLRPCSLTTLLCPQVPAESTAGPRPRGRLHQWLHRLQEAEKKVSDWGGTSFWGQRGAQMANSH